MVAETTAAQAVAAVIEGPSYAEPGEREHLLTLYNGVLASPAMVS